MIRSNHYEAAFEEYLRQRRTAYVAVDESRRTLLADASLKSLDFIVYSQASANLLIDVKGRKQKSARHWENWTEVEDLSAMTQWEDVFGSEFRGLFVFAYECVSDTSDASVAHFLFRNKAYQFYGVWADEYRKGMKMRSPSWQTVWMPAASYRKARFSLDTLFASESKMTG